MIKSHLFSQYAVKTSQKIMRLIMLSNKEKNLLFLSPCAVKFKDDPFQCIGEINGKEDEWKVIQNCIPCNMRDGPYNAWDYRPAVELLKFFLYSILKPVFFKKVFLKYF